MAFCIYGSMVLMITIFTDGSSRGNPGPGGWGAVIVAHDDEIENPKLTPSGAGLKIQNEAHSIELGGREENTTNNRMEMTAAIQALRKISNFQFPISNSSKGGIDHTVVIYSDSSYLINGATKWLSAWKRGDWMTKAKKEVLNRDLWMELDEVMCKIGMPNISWKYVGGHVGIAGNERCDEIATAFADEASPDLYEGPLSSYPVQNVLDVSHDEMRAVAKKSGSSRSGRPAYSYISRVDGKIETHRTWAECEKRVKGVSGARFKKSLDAEDESRIIAEFSR